MTDYNIDDYCHEILPLGAPREDWLAARREGVGGSDCSAVMGFRGEYESQYTLWENKTGRVPDQDLSDNENILWGNLLEPVIRTETAHRLRLDVHQRGTLRSNTRPWQQFNPDGLFSDGGLLECKNTSQWMAGDWNGQVPDHAELQVQHGMAVTGASHAYVAGLVGGNRLIVERIERDDTLIDLINTTEAAFWQHVLDDTEPPVDGSTATRAALVRKFPIEDRPVEVPLEVGAAIQADWHAGHAEEKAGKARKKAAENRARALMAGGNRLVTDGHVWARIKGGVFAPKKFETEMPGVADLYRKKVEVIDLDAIKAEQPAVFRKFQAQVFEALK